MPHRFSIARFKDLLHRPAGRPLMWVLGYVLVFVLALGAPPLHFFSEVRDYLPLHLTLEFVSMAVAAMVFTLAWNLRGQAHNSHTLILGASFLFVCLVDGAHSLSYAGMPDLLTPAGAGKAINFWLMARLAGALALLAVALLPLKNWSLRQCWLLLGCASGLSLAVIALGLLYPDAFPATFVDGSGLTAFKVMAEYTLVGLYLAAGLLLFRMSHTAGKDHLAWLAAAALIQALGEVLFTLYAQVADVFNVLGHVYKASAFLLVYRALVVTGIRAPLRALDVERARLRSVLTTIPDLVWLKDTHGVYLACNAAFERFFGAAERDIVGKTDYDFVPTDMADMFRKNDRAAMASQGPVMNEEALSFKNGGYTGMFETTKTAMRDEHGEILGVLGVSHDITDRKNAEAKLQISASVFTHAREGIMLTDAQGDILDVNASFTRITGYAREEVIGQNPRILSSGRQTKEYYSAMWGALVSDGHWTSEVWNRRKNGEVFAELQTISAVRDSDGQIQQYVALFSDISAFKEHEHKLEHIAHYDALTNLPNRVLFADRLHQAISQRRGGSNVAVVFLDLDGFKAINDTHGHEAGDSFLVQLASRMHETLREGDTLARMGGDEFVVVLSGLHSVEDCVPLLNRLLSVANQPLVVGNTFVQVSASMGVTFYPQNEDVDGEQLLRQADQAMYQAKLAGKNRFHIFDALHDRTVRDLHESLLQIKTAIDGDEFVLYYQPQVNMRTGDVVGAEALIRWQHPQRGFLAPGSFLPVIENQALAVDLGEWVIRAALRQLRAWGQQGLVLPVSVNVGARQLLQANFVERLTQLLREFPDVPTSQLKLEVLETSALEDVAGASQVIEDCRRMGITFALDDFGTGYSSLTYLKRLPVKLLKIDQSFVRGMLTDTDDLAILTGVISLACAFRRDVIAEGVETIAHGTLLLQLGCDLGQGYGIARPMPAHELPQWVKTWHPDAAWIQATRSA
ncbi:MAG: GGDEF domain-containing protein [Burkholderiales bacterium PBB4]|nr:MAG: GGDEF domain-containing protein [Burkholderiales bacterium PBB4]